MNGAVFSECASDLGVRRVQRGGRLKRGGRTFSGVGEVKYGWKGVDRMDIYTQYTICSTGARNRLDKK